MIGAHTIMVWSATQGVTALSSGEAELYSMVKGSANTLGLMSLAADLGMALNGVVHSDASAAIGIVNRTGVGRLRHVRVQYLWLQDTVRDGALKVKKVKGEENPADLMTKHVSAELIRRHCNCLGYEQQTDRAKSAPKLDMLEMSGSKGDHVNVWLRSEVNNLSVENDSGDWLKCGERVSRVHSKPRIELFTPMRIAGAPPAKALTPIRITEGRFKSGKEFRKVDTWTARATAHESMPAPWTGKTTFVLRSE
jgi:hypothetical protein